MLYNGANIFNTEARFAHYCNIWEFLYARETGRESLNLSLIMNSVLGFSWNATVHNPMNIYRVIRNQLTHSGLLPIDRPYAEQWMKALNNSEVGWHITFFERLTQAIVLKTVGVNLENLDSQFSKLLDEFLQKGRFF